MKKFLSSILLIILAVSACTTHKTEEESIEVMVAGPEPVYYSDWDRAIRADVDLQNMFVDAPSKIEKPIDIYMAMALALKYNYSRRLISYEQSLLETGKAPAAKLPDIVATAGYSNDTLNSRISPDMKVAWNILDITGMYYQSAAEGFQAGAAVERSRKVIHNIMQETRSLYWQTLASQKLNPVIDEMVEYMTLDIDELNVKAKELAQTGKSLTTKELQRKRQYMDSVKKLLDLKRKMETAEIRLAGLMGFHPTTQYKLVGKEYGNFELPALKNELSQLEWLALVNRPELRIYDLQTNTDELKIVVKSFRPGEQDRYKNDPNYYNRLWSKEAKDIGMTIIEDVRNPQENEADTLRRQRMTNLILNQVYLAWAWYTSAVEDYQVNMEIASTSEDIAENISLRKGSRSEKTILAGARAVSDEVSAFQAYAEVQDSLGNLYATVGLDAIPYTMLEKKPSQIAIALRKTMEEWRKGVFIPDARPHPADVPGRRPAINMSGEWMPDVTYEVGQRIKITIPQTVFDKMQIRGNFTTNASLRNHKPLPQWLKYNPQNYTFTGVAMPGDAGTYPIKIYISDSSNRVGYIEFRLKIIGVYQESLSIRGLTDGSRTTVLKRCVGSQCKDNYVDEHEIGTDVEYEPHL
ncbi:MAG: TolC family protein [Alphaproteobacteria bacterium]|nr:TolC family protein [Alphaproteobacteria bacterium]